jgi:hypothetical protein
MEGRVIPANFNQQSITIARGTFKIMSETLLPYFMAALDYICAVHSQKFTSVYVP